MLVGRRHVPDKLDLISPITTTFVVVVIVSRVVTLTFCWQLLMPINCESVATDILLLVLVADQACSQGPCTVSGRRPSSSRGGCGPDRVLDVFMPDVRRTDQDSSESVSPMAVRSFVWQEIGELSRRAELPWLADEQLCWLGRVWIVTRQP